MKDYQRKHLRAPYKMNVLFGSNNFVFKAHALNISEGGILLDQIPYFPEEEEVPILLNLPRYPYFKNFDLDKMRSFSKELFKAKVIRVSGTVVRKISEKSKIEDIVSSRVGVRFTKVDKLAKVAIAEYVDVFASNLIFLQVLLDNTNTHGDSVARTRALAKLLHYPEDIKLALLRKSVSHDYQSLQWN